MMYTFLIVLILIASILMVLAVLVQNPKSGMASNFGASNQVMGVRQTADFLEKFTWGAAVVVLVLSLLSTIFIGGKLNEAGKSGAASDLEMLSAPATEQAVEMPQAELPAATEEAPAQN
ncbi:MAG: preprotein translocase subunit SecG [Rikenellaceae bacterium]|nr:preprotein translocase subunit SecG [Rikenellaceae bacterium]